MEFQCTCGAMLASDDPPGTQVQCPTCGQLLLVPAPVPQPQMAPQPQPAPAAEQPAPQTAPPEGELIRFTCSCGKPLRTRRPSGTQARCPRCGQIVIVPEPGQVAPTASTGESAFIPSQPADAPPAPEQAPAPTPPPEPPSPEPSAEVQQHEAAPPTPEPPAPEPPPEAPPPEPSPEPAPEPAPEPEPPPPAPEPTPEPPPPAPTAQEAPAPPDILNQEVDPAQLAATTPLPGLGSEGGQEPPQEQQPSSRIPETSALASSQQLQLQCECGVALETDQPPGTSVQCPSCSRLLVVPGDEPSPGVGYPPPENEGIEFQCVCGCTLASSEPPGTEVQCPSCGRMVIVPHDMGETQQVVADMVAAAAAPPPPPPPPPAPTQGGMLEFACTCGTTLASAEPPGTEVSCPTCQRIVAVPSPAGAPAAVAAAEPPAGGQPNVGLYILIGVAILAVVIIGSVVALVLVLGKKPPQEQPAQQQQAATAGTPQAQGNTGTAPPQATPQAATQAPNQATGGQKPTDGQGTAAKPDAQEKVEEAPENVEAAGGVDDLIERLGSTKDDARDEAEDQLGDMGNDAVEALRGALIKGADADVKQRAARCLRRIGSGDAVGALKTGLKDKDARVRKTCARSLGSVGGEAASALPSLIDVLTDKELEVRETVSDALESIGEHVVDDAGDLVEVNPKKLQSEWRKWFEAGAKPDKLDGAVDLDGAEQFKTEKQTKKAKKKKAEKKDEKKDEKKK